MPQFQELGALVMSWSWSMLGIFELGIIVLLAAAFGMVARLLRQPILVAYLAVGVVVGSFSIFHLDQEGIRIFADLGIMFLLFLIGLEIDYASVKIVGKTSIVLGMGQIVFTFIGGFFISWLFGIALLPAAYIAIALTFSSTIIMVKLLSERKDLRSLYGKLSIGFLLVQDIVAILVLTLLTGIDAGQGFSLQSLIITTLTVFGLLGAMIWLGRTVFPPLFRRVARSHELLFVTSLGWLFLLASLSEALGLSIEIGGFLAGLALANSSEHFQIAGRVKPLRDFFLLIFFVVLGSSLALSSLAGLTWPIVVFSLFVLIGNPLIVLVIMGIMGHRKRTSFKTGMMVAQISEFSLILVALGLRLGHIGQEVVALVTGVGVVTIVISTYMVTHMDRLYDIVAPILSVFERRWVREEGEALEAAKPIILVGAHRTGQSIVRHLPKDDVLVVDFDPDVIAHLRRHGYVVLYGDMTDPEIIDAARMDEAELVISTNPDIRDNERLLSVLRGSSSDPKVVVRADDVDEARYLYEQGADYVLLPHLLSGHQLSRILASSSVFDILTRMREHDRAVLEHDPLDPMAPMMRDPSQL